MKLSDADITEFQAIYKKETGQDITKEQAAEYALHLIELLALVTGTGPIPLPPS
jgi:hypothetical protein